MLAIAIGVIIIMATLALLAYISFSPQYAEPKALAAFNKATIIVIVALTILFYLNGKTLLPLSSDLKEIMSVIFAFLFELVLVTILFVVRNFWLFKPPKR